MRAIVALLLVVAGCATLPNPPIHPVAVVDVPRDYRGEPIIAAVRLSPGGPAAPPVKVVKPVSCKHARRCP